MRIDVDNYSFSVPWGFFDSSDYTYTVIGGEELLVVTTGTVPALADTLDDLLLLRRQELSSLPGMVTIEAEGASRMGDRPARTITFRLHDRPGDRRERWGLACDGPDRYVQLCHVVPADDERAEGRFDHIMGSVAWSESLHDAPVGWRRRRARGVWLDVPAAFTVPRSYQLYNQDETIRLDVIHDHSGDATSVERALAREAAPGEVVASAVTVETLVRELPGTVHAMTFRDPEMGASGEVLVRIARFALPQGPTVLFCGRADRAHEQPLEVAFETLVRSLQVPAPRSVEGLLT